MKWEDLSEQNARRQVVHPYWTLFMLHQDSKYHVLVSPYVVRRVVPIPRFHISSLVASVRYHIIPCPSTPITYPSTKSKYLIPTPHVVQGAGPYAQRVTPHHPFLVSHTEITVPGTGTSCPYQHTVYPHSGTDHTHTTVPRPNVP